jgi:mRNA-decapping enzyme 1B
MSNLNTVLDLDNRHSSDLNLAVLTRLDKDVESIIATASHVVIYSFDPTKQLWNKKEIEGSLFIVKRSTEPNSRLFVINRLSRVNLVQDIISTIELQHRKPYLMYRDSAKPDLGVIGIWFHDENERKSITKHLKTLVDELKERADISQNAFPQPVHNSPSPSATPSASMSSHNLAPSAAALFAANNQVKSTTINLSNLNLGATPSHLSSHPSSSMSSAPNPAAVAAATAAAVTSSLHLGEIGIVLSKKQLQTVLLDMVNDSDFIAMIHKRYLEKVTRDVS